MVVYICENCKKEFNKKSNYLNHIGNKKKSCSQLKLNMHQNAPKCTKNISCNNITNKLYFFQFKMVYIFILTIIF